MKIYWYWPFVREEELAAGKALALMGHHVCVHTIAGRVDTARFGDSLTLDESVPAVTPKTEGTLKWLASRTTTYPSRARVRANAVSHASYDVAHVIYLNYFTDWVALRAISRHVPLVSTVHDVVPHQSRVPRRIERELLARQYDAAGTIVVHHPLVGERLIDEFSVDPARIHHIPWPVPLVANGEYRTPRSRLQILMFGTLRRNKGVDVMIEALRRIPTADLQLTIAGQGFADIEASVRTAAASDHRIRAELGFVSAERKADLFQAADVVALPYTSFSSQSAVLHDAYAYHRPVIVSDVGALGRSVRDDQTGWIVDPNEPDQLAEAILLAIADGVGHATYSEHARIVAEQRSPAAVAERLANLYQICAKFGANL